MRAFQNCLVCGASTENTHSARRGADALVCGGECYKQASRNFKRNMSGYKLARLVDLLAQMGEPVTAAELLDRYRETYGRSGMTTIVNSVALTSQLRPIVNPETIRVDKTKNPFTFEYLGGTTIGEWLKPSMRAKYESVSFRSEASYGGHSEYAPTERIIQRLKDSGVWELGNTYEDDGLQYIWWATVKIEDGTLVSASLEEDFLAEDLINLVLLVDDRRDHSKFGRLAVSIADMDNAKFDIREWDEELTQLGKELTIVFQNNGMFQSDDDLERGGMGEYFDVYWGDLVNHSCADNAKFDIYEEDEGEGLITMECMECGRTATFRQETPYEGPRNAGGFRWFESESTMPKIPKGIKTGGWQQAAYIYPNGDIFSIEDFSEVYDMTVYDIWHYSGNMPKIDAPKNTWIYDDEVESWDWDKILDKAKNQANKEYDTLRAEEEGELRTYEVSVPVLHYYSIGPVEAYDEDEAVDEVRNNWRSHWRSTIEDNGDWGGPLWRYSRLSSHEPEAHEIFDSETFGAERQPELAVSVGDRVRSYDFVLPDGTLIRDDCYMEGRVTKIAPVDWCGAECDHYYILVEKIVRNGEELSERQPGVDMVYPPVSESYLEIINETFAAEYETFEVETDEYQGPFEVEIRRPNGSVVSWKKYETYRELIEALENIVSNRYTPYAIDVFATKVSHISGFTAMGPVTDYRKFHLATWKYGNWESGPWAEHFPTGLE